MPAQRPLGIRQRGVALFVCLALLLVLSIGGASAVRTTILEARMARNAGDALAAFQAAEAALREGEALLVASIDSTARFTETGQDGLWTPAPPDEAERWATAGVWGTGSGRSRVVSNSLDHVAVQPRFLIEWLASLPTHPSPHLLEESTAAVEERLEIFRVTGWGVGRTENASAMVQSTFALLL